MLVCHSMAARRFKQKVTEKMIVVAHIVSIEHAFGQFFPNELICGNHLPLEITSCFRF